MDQSPFKLTTTRFDHDLAEVTLQYTGLEPIDVLQASCVGPLDCMLSPYNETTTPFLRVPGNELIWRTTIPQPYYWIPESPSQYRVEFADRRWPVIHWGIKSLLMRKRQFLLQQEPIQWRGVRLQGTLDNAPTPHLKLSHVNLLLVPLTISLASLPMDANRLGFHVLYEVNPEDDASLWYAEEVLSQHVSTFGYVLPQASMSHPQLWHNAMLHLHRQRRDIFVGIAIDTVPLTMVQGHVEFLLAPAAFIDDLAAVRMPLIETVRRFDLLMEPIPDRMAGRISRVMPEDMH